MWMPMEVGVDYAANSITMICLKFANIYTITCIKEKVFKVWNVSANIR
jgi:hypothetical protein